MDRKPPEFTSKELKYFRNTDFLRTKRSIISGFISLFEALQIDIINYLEKEKFLFFNDLSTKSGKITKGENYKELPFVVLDCPRHFGKPNVLAYRSIFWWGHYLSNHFLLKGQYKDQYSERIREAWPLLKSEPVYLDMSDNPWNHDLESGDFVQISQLNKHTFNELLHNHDFLKLVWRMELDQWNKFHQFSLKNLATIAQIINT